MTRPSTPANNPSTPPTAPGAPDPARADAQNLEPDHVEIIGEIDNESGDEDKAPTLSNERYRR